MLPQLVLVAVHGHVQLGPVVSAQSRQAVGSAVAVHWGSLVHPVGVLLHVLRQIRLLCGRFRNMANEIRRISVELKEITGPATS